MNRSKKDADILASLSNEELRAAQRLIVAVEKGSVREVRQLLQASAPVNVPVGYRGRHALHTAAFKGNAAVVRELLAGGADVNAGNDSNMSALALAAFQRRVDTCMALLEADNLDLDMANDKGWTALMQAANQGLVRVTRELIRRGAALDAANQFGYTALALAASSRRSECVDCLVAAGADTRRACRVLGKNAAAVSLIEESWKRCEGQGGTRAASAAASAHATAAGRGTAPGQARTSASVAAAAAAAAAPGSNSSSRSSSRPGSVPIALQNRRTTSPAALESPTHQLSVSPGGSSPLHHQQQQRQQQQQQQQQQHAHHDPFVSFASTLSGSHPLGEAAGSFSSFGAGSSFYHPTGKGSASYPQSKPLSASPAEFSSSPPATFGPIGSPSRSTFSSSYDGPSFLSDSSLSPPLHSSFASPRGHPHSLPQTHSKSLQAQPPVGSWSTPLHTDGFGSSQSPRHVATQDPGPIGTPPSDGAWTPLASLSHSLGSGGFGHAGPFGGPPGLGNEQGAADRLAASV
eukprot:CAMPEP_0170756116 /NCGR_PEP_ID=MMETSP0437-20130122/13863_1 /TAXON_ID=0 /ORGANISM="Sexangularia sp." /LENGTH=519 /DNA_ID=CAMNT_0011095297 /DNA_START=104 /DNA_END=1660 /DNA_ORIENTATION=-